MPGSLNILKPVSLIDHVNRPTSKTMQLSKSAAKASHKIKLPCMRKASQKQNKREFLPQNCGISIKGIYGKLSWNSLVAQGPGLSTSTVVAQVQYLIQEGRSRKCQGPQTAAAKTCSWHHA